MLKCIFFRAKAQKDAAKRAGKGSQLGSRAAGLQVRENSFFLVAIKITFNFRLNVPSVSLLLPTITF
jgi:hypothetical protein